ncbi:type II secretion system F family protein [Tritonibacter mobilis]|uniref:type II secretion system F family protein n=1 Tax=Tritonibacter mobilis TaxID=379347 RepID=UPI000E0D65BF|nr:type II secretion system F family protein [Tritonibacter mobilis]NHM20561.1 type II secretion system F family protein [Tritonibacter mobilis]NHM24723.1 type II secretion system F family protein [Tritonibacter mobilis]
MPEPSLFLLAAVIVPIMIVVQLYVFSRLDHRARLARLARSVGAMQGGSAKPAGAAPFAHLGNALSRIAALTAERLSVVKGGEAESSAALLRAAGFRSRDAVLIHAFLKLVLPLLGAGLAALWLYIGGNLTPLTGTIWICGGALVLSKGPDLFLAYRRNKRLESVRRNFPDMLELLVIASEGGLAPGAALSRVGQEMNVSCPPLALDMQHLVIELGVLPDRTIAWHNLEDRLPLPEISVFVNALLQAERYGTPFAGALRTLMKEERASRLLKIEEKAGRVPALMTIPLIAFIMPALFVVLIGPAALNILDNIMNGAF